MTVYSVGAPYNPGRKVWPETPQFNFRGGQYELVLFYARPTPAEIRDIRTGRAEFALAVEGDVILFLYRFGAAGWSDASYSWHLVPAAEQEAPAADQNERERDLLHIILVDASTGIVEALRLVSLSPELSFALRTVITEQIARPWPGPAEFDRQLAATYQRYSSEALATRASARCIGGDS